MNPTFSIIMTTFNRSKTLPRAINSVLELNESDWELIIIDDGSTDDSMSVLEKFDDPRIHLYKHAMNKGVAAAKNTGLDNIHGEWFTFLDSDDEIVPAALTEFRKIQKMDPSINAITCNCVDSVSGKFSGLGLDRDQYLDFGLMVRNCHGEYWGFTKCILLNNNRFNEKLYGGESILWFKISRAARRYYIHQGLRIYHTEGNDRVSQKTPLDLEKSGGFYTEMAKETEYLNTLREFCHEDYIKLLFKIGVSYILSGQKTSAKQVVAELSKTAPSRAIFLRIGNLIGPKLFERLYRIVHHIHNENNANN